MKTYRSAFLVIVLGTILAAISTGCATAGSIPDSAFVQTVLNQVLPPGFEGDLQGNHDGFYFGTSIHLTIDLHGLKKVGDKWTWTSGGYTRSGFFSTGGIKLTPTPKT